jgi:hypothetical protein
MRASHEGSLEVAHGLRDQKQRDRSSAINMGKTYDLIVVSAGMKGLARGLAADHYFQKNMGRTASVLILDDFDCYAKRNEFRYNVRTLALNGARSIESPNFYNAPAKQLLADVGIDRERYEKRPRRIVRFTRH